MPSNRHPTRRNDPVDLRRASALRRLGPAPFTTEAAHVAGLTRSDLRSDAVTPVLRGVYAAGARPVTHELRCAAALALAPEGARVAGLSAARLWGLPVPDAARVHLEVPDGSRMRHGQVKVVARGFGGCAARWLPDVGVQIRVSSPQQVLAECLDELSLVEAVVLADAVRARGVPVIDEYPPGRANARERALLRRILALSDTRAESAMESRTRLLLELAGLRGMVSQYVVTVGGRARRIDLAFPEQRIAIEYDGSHHFVSDEQRQEDIRRAEDLRAAGWIVIHLVAKDVYVDPAATIERVARALRSRGAIVRLADEWTVHFPQRMAKAA